MPGPTTSGAHLYLVLWRATRAVERFDHTHIRELGLGLSDFSVLECLLQKGPQPVTDIGRRVLLTSGSMTAAIDRLESEGLVERRPDAHDRRLRVVHLSTKGRHVVERAFALHARALERLVDPLTQDERATLLDLLRRLGRRAEALLETPTADEVGGALDEENAP